jgi:phosphoglycolate phosphatase
MTAEIRAVLFDKDGTLIDFRATWLPAYEAIVREMAGADAALAHRLLATGGYDAASGEIDPTSPLAAGTNHEIATVWAGILGRDDVTSFARDVNDRFIAHARGTMVATADLPALFGRLRDRGFALGVATNDSEVALHQQLMQLGIDDLVDFACGFDSGHGAKPGPGMVEAFARARGLPARAIAVVGDSLHDLDMARAAGAGLTIGVLTGASPHATLAPHADHVLASIADIESVLTAAQPPVLRSAPPAPDSSRR